MPNADLLKILKDVIGQSYQAEYQPVLTGSGDPAPKPTGCTIPAFDNRTVNATLTTAPVIDKQCLLPFNPIPITPAPYVPIEDIAVPCPNGFSFESDYTSTVGQTITYSNNTIIGSGVAFGALIPSTNGVPTAGIPLPLIELNDGQQRRITALTGCTGSNCTGVFIQSNFSPAVNTNPQAFKLRRIVIQSSDSTSGLMKFVKTDPNGCTGLFTGEIKINAGDINVNVPCGTSGYNPGTTVLVKVINKNLYSDDNDINIPKLQLQYTGQPCSLTLSTVTPNQKFYIPKLTTLNSTYITWDAPINLSDGTETKIKANLDYNTLKAQLVNDICNGCAVWA